MAELRPFTPPPAVGPVSGPRERPRRFISTSPDGLSGFWTSESDEEIAAENAALAAERARIAEQNLRYTPVAIAQAAAEREAAELRAFAEAWPEGPRAGLRIAHDNLRTAEAALRQCQGHARAANDHVAQCRAEVERTAAVVEAIRQRQSTALRDRLAGVAIAPSVAANDERAEAEAMTAAEKARRGLVLAQATADDIAATVRNAEGAVAAAKRRIEECARALCTQAARERRSELAELERQAEALKRHIWDLEAVRDYPQAARWQPHLQLLLTDPEASLLAAEVAAG
jgi:hypothetical protein